MKFGTGGEGNVGKNDEELEPHLLVALARWEMVGRGLVDGEQRGRRRASAARMLLRSRVEEEWPGSCARVRWS